MSTQSSLHYIERDKKDNHAHLHVYNECFDREEDVCIEVWEQGEEENRCETIVIPKDLWDRLVKEIKEIPE